MPLLNFGPAGADTGDQFAEYLTSALRSALHLQTGTGGDYEVRCRYKDWVDAQGEKHTPGVIVIPHFPVDQPIDFAFYTSIYKTLSVSAFPFYTVIKPSGLQLLELPDQPYETARGLYFPWLKGTPKRLVYPTFEKYAESYVLRLKTKSMTIPLMGNFNLDFEHTTHVAIAGQSGSGKSYLVRYFLPYLVTMGKLVLVDPKADDLVLWAKSSAARTLFTKTGTPQVAFPKLVGAKPGAFMVEVGEILAKIEQEMMQRELTYMNTGKRPFGHIFIVIDELLALTQGASKQDKENFFSHLSSLALLGRSAKIHLVLISQRFSAEAMPTGIRDQLQAVFQLGPITKSNTQFLFPDYDSEGVIPPRGQGTGICQVQGDIIPYPRPFLSPTYQ